MTTALNIMNPKAPHCLIDTPIQEIIQRFADEDVTGMLVVDEKRHLFGIITESDLIDQQASLHIPTAMAIFDMVIPMGEDRFEEELARMAAMTAADLMATEVKTVSPETKIDEIASLMSEGNVHHLPVVKNDKIEGLISKHDLIKALAKKQK
ncbi:MAG: CBS domain-containing protein [Mariprofundaceae bacterium]|nr:CBS domain-containing protein [Mariprofundaceae bacterium]